MRITGGYGTLEKKNARWPRLVPGIEHVSEYKNDKEKKWEWRVFFKNP